MQIHLYDLLNWFPPIGCSTAAFRYYHQDFSLLRFISPLPGFWPHYFIFTGNILAVTSKSAMLPHICSIFIEPPCRRHFEGLSLLALMIFIARQLLGHISIAAYAGRYQALIILLIRCWRVASCRQYSMPAFDATPTLHAGAHYDEYHIFRRISFRYCFHYAVECRFSGRRFMFYYWLFRWLHFMLMRYAHAAIELLDTHLARLLLLRLSRFPRRFLSFLIRSLQFIFGFLPVSLYLFIASISSFRCKSASIYNTLFFYLSFPDFLRFL